MIWDEFDDGDDLSDDDPDDDGEDDPTEPCPYCGRPVYDDSPRCPSCERYLSREDRPWSKPAWIVAGVVICLGLIAVPYLCYLVYLGLSR